MTEGEVLVGRSYAAGPQVRLDVEYVASTGKSTRRSLPFLLLPFVVILLFAGCRRTDVREMTVSMPGLVEADKTRVVEALSKYAGVEKDSYKWDMDAKTLTLRYDSMQVAQANIRYAIDEKGVKVAFPEKKDDRAGY